MDAFLTNGTRSIPVVVLLDKASLKVLGHWGPRPVELQTFVLENIQQINAIKDEQQQKLNYNEFLTKTQRWYAKDKTYSTQKEFLDLLKKVAL
jgi:hypothetical protein